MSAGEHLAPSATCQIEAASIVLRQTRWRYAEVITPRESLFVGFNEGGHSARTVADWRVGAVQELAGIAER